MIKSYQDAWTIAEQDWNKGTPVWREITDAIFYQLLEVLPPIYTPFGFLVSEAITADAVGMIYLAVTQVNGQSYVRCMYRHEAMSTEKLLQPI